MKDKVVIVTGGSRGIGVGITTAFLQAGAKVVVAYRANQQAAEVLRSSLLEYQAQLFLIQADISLAADRKKLLSQAIEHCGRIDVLVNNAGIVLPSNVLTETEEQFDQIISTNLKGPVFLAQACANYMIEQGIEGNVVNVSSVSAKVPNAPTAYCCSKAGLEMASKKMAYSLAKHKIRVNTVIPGTIRSDMNRRYWHDNPEKWQQHVSKLPMQRGGEPNELAAAVVFVASEQASFMTGAELLVDGGNLLKPDW